MSTANATREHHPVYISVLGYWVVPLGVPNYPQTEMCRYYLSIYTCSSENPLVPNSLFSEAQFNILFVDIAVPRIIRDSIAVFGLCYDLLSVVVCSLPYRYAMAVMNHHVCPVENW